MSIEKFEPSYDVYSARLEKLKVAVPESFADGKINWEVLKECLGELIEDEGADREHYAFTWPGKKDARRLAAKPPQGTLVPAPGEGVDEDKTDNIFIEGDNLEVLKLLQKSYAERVKMIYIDPPYNTGNDFIYNDNFTQPLDEYLKMTGQIDAEGNPLVSNKKSDGRFHSKWMNMIYPRLLLAKNLLREDGVIFISIDDNEVDNLKKMCGEIFGEENFVANIIWQKKFSRANDAAYFSTMHDHILCYAKNSVLNGGDSAWNIRLLPRGNEIPEGYSNPDNDRRGDWTSVVLSAKSGTQKLVYEITTPSGRKCLPPDGRFWGVNKDKFNELVKDERIWFGKEGDGIPRLKTFLSEVQDGLRPNTIWFHQEVGHNQEGRQEVKSLFDDKAFFDGPKPVRLLSQILHISNTKPGDIVLDFFSGSGTTAHAVLNLNFLNEGNRRFICIQLPEVTEETGEAFKSGFKNIAEIAKDRIRRAIKKITEGKRAEDLQGLDLGFKTFKLSKSHFKEWRNYAGQDTKELMDLFAQQDAPLVDGWEPGNLIIEILLQERFPLNSKVTRVGGIQTNLVHQVKSEMCEHLLYICFDKNVSSDSIKALPLSDKDIFICLDGALTDEQKVALSDKGLIKTI